MKQYSFILLLVLFTAFTYAQNQHHVFPSDHEASPGKTSGDGSLENPWDLQTALGQKQEQVNPGDTVWLHKGIYNGRFVSKLKGSKNQLITVSAYKNDKVILNGNVISKQNGVLIVKGEYVLFRNFEITWLGDFSRDATDADFQACAGLVHLSGVNCEFYNLKIHDNPGLGIGSWKHGAGSTIENCIIYNNGFISKVGKGAGEGIYVQNKSDEVRLIKNNIIYNNYYKGIEVWSAGKRTDFEYVKNITLEGNIIFNSGSPSGHHYDNVIVASADRNGINVAKNINLVDNILYHNTADENGNVLGDAASLTLGFNKNTPIENVRVEGNIITGGYNGLRLLYAKSLIFKNNTIYSGNIQVGPSMGDYFKAWEFENNTIFTNRRKPFRVTKIKDYDLQAWRKTFNLDKASQIKPMADFNLSPVVKLSQHVQNPNYFNLALFSSEGTPVSVSFSEHNIKSGQTYTIVDVENSEIILKTGIVSEDLMIEVPMQSKGFAKPHHNTKAKKTLSSLGVFQIEFEAEAETESEPEKTNFERFLDWLGL